MDELEEDLDNYGEYIRVPGEREVEGEGGPGKEDPLTTTWMDWDLRGLGDRAKRRRAERNQREGRVEDWAHLPKGMDAARLAEPQMSLKPRET